MYPIQLNISNKTVVIIGGGKIAWRKFKKVMHEAKTVKVVSPEFNPAFYTRTWAPHITLDKKAYDSKDIADANLIIIATNDVKVNQQVHDDARPEQWVNHTGDRRQSDFYNSFDFVHNEMTISVSSEGQSIQRSQAYGAKIKAYLETLEEDFHE
ncbi:siroheme synthase [Staphylococcus schleiferi]|nr:siroheme synthase [Staphylococcus schleiferi]